MFALEGLRELINERLTAAAAEILGAFEQTISVYEEELDRQRRLLHIVLKPEIRLHRTELPQQQVCKEEEEEEEEVLTDQQLCNPGRVPEPPHVKEEQEELCTSQEAEQLVLKQEEDFLNSDPSCERSDQSAGWTVVLNCDQNQSAAEKETPDNTSNERVVSESHGESCGASNGGRQLFSERGKHGNAAKLKNKLRGTSASTANIKLKIKNGINDQEHKAKSGENTESTCNSQPKADDKTSKCNSSSKDFYLSTQLKGHLRTHAAERPFSCTVCGKGFSCKRYLKQHMIIHSSEKPHTCILCRKGFRRLEHLQIHMRSHTGERPYSCVYCKRAFSVSSTLTKHIRLHTG